MAITLDFTGFFYEIDIDFDSLGVNPTVKKLTLDAVGKTGNKGGKLIYAQFSDRGFLSSAYVEHRANPVTRQQDAVGAPVPCRPLPTGIYGYDDTFETNRIPGVQVSFSLAWQYYIFRNGALISGASATSTSRTVVPADQSNTATPLEDNDIVRWRLVAIGGLKELVEFRLAEMPADKRAMLQSRASQQRLTLREFARTLDAE